MTYSLFDDEDLNAFERERQEMAMLENAYLAPPSGIAPLPSSPPPQLAEPMAPLRDDGTAPDWATAVSIGASGLGAIADLALNKGRNTGAILAAGAAGADRSADIRLRSRQEAMQYEKERARQGLEQQQLAERAKYNQYLDRSLGARVDKEHALNEDRDASRGIREQGQDPSAFIAWAKTKGYDLGGLKTMAQVRSAMGPLVKEWELEHADDKAGATARGRITAENALAEQTGRAKATEFEQQTPAAVARAEQTAQATMDEKATLAGEQAGAREAATGAGESRREQRSQSKMNKFRDETEKTRPLVTIGKNLDSVMAKYPGDQPGVGMWDSFKSGKLSNEDDLAVRNAVSNMTDLVARVRSGAAIPPPEFEKIAGFVAGGTGATEQQFKIAWAATKRWLQTEMKQQSAGRENEARSVLGGDADWALGPAPAPGGAGPIRLGPTGGGAPGAVNMPAAGGGGMVPVVSPSGQRGMVTPEQAQQLRGKPGWQVP